MCCNASTNLIRTAYWIHKDVLLFIFLNLPAMESSNARGPMFWTKPLLTGVELLESVELSVKHDKCTIKQLVQV